jgi:hypothetical protein
MGDASHPLDNLIILVIRIADQQISAQSLESFLQSKQLKTEIDKALTSAIQQDLKSGLAGKPASANVSLPKSLASGVEHAAIKRAEDIYKEKYQKDVDANVSALEGEIKNHLKTVLKPGVYLTHDHLIYIVIGLAAGLAVTKGPVILRKMQDVCKPDKFLCSAMSEVAVLNYVKKKEIGKVSLDAGGGLSFSPSFDDLKADFIGKLQLKGLNVALKLDLVYDVTDASERFKSATSSLDVKQQINPNWSVSFSAKDVRSADPTLSSVQIGLKGDYASGGRHLSLEADYSNAKGRPVVTAMVNCTLLTF